jgi:hypothetical protein
MINIHFCLTPSNLKNWFLTVLAVPQILLEAIGLLVVFPTFQVAWG